MSNKEYWFSKNPPWGELCYNSLQQLLLDCLFLIADLYPWRLRSFTKGESWKYMICVVEEQQYNIWRDLDDTHHAG